MLKQLLTNDEFFANKHPGVTTLLSNVLGKDEFKDIPEAILKAAGERGSAVHSYIEHFILYKEWPPIELAYQIYIDYFIEWYEEYKPEFISAEQKLINEKDGYKGIIDTVFYYIDKDTNKKVLCMCDWKTSSNLNRFKTMCQLNLYEKMWKNTFKDYKIDEIRTLSITKTGWRFSKFELNAKISNSILYLNKLKNKYNGS
jgi:hypothetical protein